MKKNAYRDLTEQIQPPAGLNDRVLFAARRRAAGREAPAPKRLLPKRRTAFRAAVCAACALALVAGSFTLGPAPGGETEAGGAPVTALPTFSFGLTACAADTGERYGANANGGLAFSAAGATRWSAESGHYTGCLFQVVGENIRTISLAIDREALYRSRTLTDLPGEEVQKYLEAEASGTEYQLPGGGDVIGAVYSGDEAEEGPLALDVVTDLGTSVTEDYDPEAYYGFLVPDTGGIDWEGDPREANQESIDRLDGARLTVTVTFADGTEQTRTYTLSTGKLRVEYGEDGTPTLLPQLAGDDDLWIYGIYAVDEESSRFFQWPVQGSNTISLSNPYGSRVKPGGQGETFHAGIDIPAPEGEVILAAADGTVSEAGFDAERGDYVVIDHGDGLTTLYGQCRDFTVEEGDTVRAGEQIGTVGKTGMSTGPHLHFEVRQDDEPQNPVAYFDSDVRDTLTMG